MKLTRLLQYGSLAILLLLAGDISPNPGLKVGHLNIRSLPKHLDERKILLQDNQLDILCRSETWLNKTWTDHEPYIDGYNIIRMASTDTQQGGGTAIYYNSKLQMILNLSGWNCLFLTKV